MTEPTLPFPDEPVAHARRTDPDTSHAAAESVTRIRQSQADVLRLFTYIGEPMTDEQVARRYANLAASLGLRAQSPSGLRTRRAELVTLGRLYDTGLRWPLLSGRLAIAWAITNTAGRPS